MSEAARARVLSDFLRGGFRQIAGAMAGLITFPVIARMLERDALGAWQVLVAASCFVGFADLGLSTAVERAAVRDDVQRTRGAVSLALSVMCILIPISACLSYMLVLAVPKDMEALRGDVALAGILAVIAGGLFAWGQPYRYFIVARGHAGAVANARMLGAIVQTCGTLGLLQVTQNVIAPATGLFLGGCVDLFVTMRAAREVDPEVPLLPRISGTRSDLASAFNTGGAGFAMNLASATALRVDVLVLSGVSTLSTVAAYSAGGRAVEMAFLLAKQAVVALTPKLGRPAERAMATFIGTLIFGGVIAAGMAAIAIVGQGAIVLWAGDVASGPTPALAMALLGGAACLAAIFEVPSSTVLLSGRTGWESAWPIVIGTAINLTLSLSLAPTYGIWAVAGSTLVGNLVTAILTWRAAMHVLSWSLGSVMRLLAMTLAPGIVVALLAWPLRPYVVGNGIASLASCIGLCSIATGVIALAFRRARFPGSVAAEEPART